jgi:Flp pilus assembly protein CpaB
MKSLIALAAIAVFTVATAVAGKPGAFATDEAIAAAKSAAVKSKPVLMAEQQLPFDRERSRN